MDTISINFDDTLCHRPYTFDSRNTTSSHNYGAQISWFMARPENSKLWVPVIFHQSSDMGEDVKMVDLSSKSLISHIKRYIDGTEWVTSKSNLPMLIAKIGLMNDITIPTVIINDKCQAQMLTKEGRLISPSSIKTCLSILIQTRSLTKTHLFFVKLGQVRYGGGNGVHLLHGNVKDLMSLVEQLTLQSPMSNWVIQTAIRSPAVYLGRKWDIRSYVILLSDADRIVAFACRRSFARISSMQYDSNSLDPRVHLTNSGIHRKSSDYDASRLKIEVAKEVTDSLILIEQKIINKLCEYLDQRGRTGYIILGFDFIFASPQNIDMDVDVGIEANPAIASDVLTPSLKPTLIEINDHPSQYMDDPVSGNIVSDIWSSLSRIFLPALASSSNPTLTDSSSFPAKRGDVVSSWRNQSSTTSSKWERGTISVPKDDSNFDNGDVVQFQNIRVSKSLEWLATASQSQVNDLIGNDHFVKITSTMPRRTLSETVNQRNKYIADSRKRIIVSATNSEKSGGHPSASTTAKQISQ